MGHPLPLTGIDIRFAFPDDRTLRIEAEVTPPPPTGVEMEALTAASVTAFTAYDTCKALDKAMIIGPTYLEEKRGGKSGDLVRAEEPDVERDGEEEPSRGPLYDLKQGDSLQWGVMTMSGEREYFYIGDRNRNTSGIKDISGIWKSVLKYGVLSASHFEVRFPDDPALSEGKDEFLQLSNILVEPWSGMKGAIAVKGEMTPETRALFLRIIDSEDIRIWDFVLFRDGKKLLSVSDYIDRIVTEHFAKEFMDKLFQSWFEAIPEPEIKPREGETTGELLEVLREMVQEALFELEKDDSVHG